VSMLMFYGAATSIDAVFSHYGRLSAPACRLSPSQIAMTLSLTVALTVAASAAAAWQIARIEPAETLREL
jgi:ABC-type lipoprotein release transport system permease subunit